MLQLQPIVERVPKAMSPMEKWQGDENEEVQTCRRMRQQAIEELVGGGLEPSQGKGQARQEEMDGEEERGYRSARAEQEPQERSDPFHDLLAQQHEGHRSREHEPGRIVQTENEPVGHSLAAPAHDHGLGGQIEPGDGVKEDKEEGNRIEREEERCLQSGEELLVGPWTLGKGA